MTQGTCPASAEAVSAPRYASRPKSVQISRYAPTKIQADTQGRLELGLSRWTRAKTRFIGAVVGSIMAMIMTTQIARNNGAPIPMVKPMPMLFIMRDCQISMTHDAAARISSSARKSGCARCKRICIVHLFILFIMNCTPRSRPAPLQAGGKLGLSASPDRFIGAGLLSAPNGERELAAALHTTAAAA